jgi:hypothetical protein
MPGIHLPALQGIAGLKPIIVSMSQILPAAQPSTYTVYTVPSDKIAILTDVSIWPLSFSIYNVYFYTYPGNSGNPYYILGLTSLAAQQQASRQCLIALPPNSVVYFSAATGSNDTPIFFGLSLLLFDYFGED